MANPFKQERESSGIFWSNPSRFIRENKSSKTKWVDMLDGLPIVKAVSRVDVVVIGSNPLIAALAARSAARRGNRVALALIDCFDPWPYDLLDNHVLLKIIQAVSGQGSVTDSQVFPRLFRSCVDAIKSVNGFILKPKLVPSTMIPDYDGSSWFYVEPRIGLRPSEGKQALLLSQFLHAARGLSVFGSHDFLGRGRMLRSDSVVMCSRISSIAVYGDGETDDDGYYQVSFELEPRLQRLGTALRSVEIGELWIRRAIADLVVFRDDGASSHEIESLLKEAYSDPVFGQSSCHVVPT